MEQVFFKGQPYTGDAAFINGSNGYECTEDHGLLCALILPEGPFEHVRSCWDKSGKPNCLTTETGKKIVNRGETGIIIKFKDGFEVGRLRQRMNEAVKEKAVSKAQQRFFGMVDAYKKGEMPDASPAIKKAADGMTKKQVKDFAKTKHKGLPNHVDESTLRQIIKNVLKEVYGVNNQEKLNELSNDTIDNAYIKVMNDVNTLPYGTPERVRRDAQLKNIKTLRNDKLGFDPVDMSIKMRQQGTSGNPSIDRKWATWQKNHDDRISGIRTYDDKTGRWTTRLTENDLRKIIKETVQMHLVDVLGKYTQGKTSSKEANKAIMDLANSSNMKLNENEFDELSISTMQNAYDKMLRYGQSNRASDLGAKSWKKIYHSNIDNLTIFTNAWGINVSDPSFTSENFIFNVEKCEWEGYQPRFADRKAAVILANLIRQECGERAGDFGNKAMYIK